MDIKARLYALCQQYVQQRIDTFQEAIDASRAAVNDETKSSAGDKYETGRAMAQLDQEKNMQQLVEAQSLKNALARIDPAQQSRSAAPGSLVITDKGNFYLAISAGKLELDGEVYYAVSLSSPIAKELLGKAENGQVQFNGMQYQIRKIY